MAYEHGKHGVAERQCYAEVDPGVLTEHTDASVQLQDTRWAQLVHIVGDDSSTSSTAGAGSTSQQIIIDGTITYICECIAGQGTVLADALWRVKKIDETDPNAVQIMWADGNNNFDNVATAAGLSTLTYSY